MYCIVLHNDDYYYHYIIITIKSYTNKTACIIIINLVYTLDEKIHNTMQTKEWEKGNTTRKI